MFNKKSITNLISIVLLVIFFLPISILALHSLTNHNHEICFSKTEQHIHDKDLECTLHIYHQSYAVLFDSYQSSTHKVDADAQLKLTQNFLKSHQQLSFSLRGPPLSVLI